MMTFSVPRRGWMRAVAVLLAGLLALGVAGGLAASAPAQGAAAAAKAQAKAAAKKAKCPKGYARAGKRCRKKQAPGKTSAIVEAVRLTSLDPSVYGIDLRGTITLKQPVTSLKATVVRSRDGRETTREDTIEGDGTSLTLDFEVTARRPLTRERSRAPITYWVVVDGVKSNVLK